MTQISCREVDYVAVAATRADAALRFFRIVGTVVSLETGMPIRSSRASRRMARLLGLIARSTDLGEFARSARTGILLVRWRGRVERSMARNRTACMRLKGQHT